MLLFLLGRRTTATTSRNISKRWQPQDILSFMLKLSDIGDPNGFRKGLDWDLPTKNWMEGFLSGIPLFLWGLEDDFVVSSLNFDGFCFMSKWNEIVQLIGYGTNNQSSFSWGSGMKNVEISQGLRWTLPIHLTKLAFQASLSRSCLLRRLTDRKEEYSGDITCFLLSGVRDHHPISCLYCYPRMHKPPIFVYMAGTISSRDLSIIRRG